MADMWDIQQRWRRRWQRWHRQAVVHLAAWRVHRHVGKAPEAYMDVQQETEVAMAKAIRQQMSEQTARALKAVMRQELLEELREEAVALAKLDLQDDFDRRKERLQDDLATWKSQLEDEAAGELDRQRDDLRQEIGDAWQEKYLTVRDQRDQARAERDRAERVLLSLVQQLLPEGKRTYLYSAGIKELDREALNEVLGRHGLRVRSRATYSERLVTVRLDAARVVGHTQFWVDTPQVAGVAEEIEPGEDAQG